MLIGNVLEKTDAVSAWQLCADKLADWVRNSWQEHTKLGIKQWEDTASEDPAAFPGLRKEGFKNLVGLDYILKWWSGDSPDGLGGELDVIWKTVSEDEKDIICYRSWIRLADRDFLLGLHKEESDKRQANREAFREGFAQWKTLFNKN